MVSRSFVSRTYHLTKIYSDPAVKQILLIMNEKENFIIEDLDEHHLVIKSEHEWRVRQELEVEVSLTLPTGSFSLSITLTLFVVQLEKNTYSVD